MQQQVPKNDDNQGEVVSIDLSEVKDAIQTLVDQGCIAIKKLSKQPINIGEDVIEKAASSGKKVIDECMVSAKEHPIAALFITFGLGFLVVKFLKRK